MPRPTRNPFLPPGPDHPVARATAVERVERVERVAKPWGHEEIYALLEGSYVGKVLHIAAGGVLSLQQHAGKDETIAVQSGRITVEHGAYRDRLETVTLRPGDRLLIRSTVVHRISAVDDSVVLETSTARPGWRADVVRLEDKYGRRGTSAP